MQPNTFQPRGFHSARLSAQALFAALLLLACSAFAAELPPLTADDEPLDEKQKARIRALINQLGDDSWTKRNAASEALERIGAPALPFLKDALEHTDEEIRTRASDLVKILDVQPKIQDVTIICAPGGLNLTGNLSSGGSGHLILTTTGVPGVTVQTTAEFPFKGRHFNIVRTTAPNGSSIVVKWTENRNGQPIQSQIEAANEAELEKKSPVIYKIYTRILGNIAERQATIREQAARGSGMKLE
jgi:hypothetical protein